jgi:putative CocE/NonD family hydrolase
VDESGRLSLLKNDSDPTIKPMSFAPNFKRPESAGMPVSELDGFRLEIDVPVRMRDGIRLATDLYFPAQPGVYPVLLERSPYGKHASVMVNIGAPQYLAQNGYVVAIQDTRGRFASEGDWYPFRDEAFGDNRDGYDTVEWLAVQPYCTGKVGSFGGSYAGFNQYTMAGAMPPHLAATFPRQAPSSLKRQWVYRGGALELAFIYLRWGRRMFVEALRNRSAQYERKAAKATLNWPAPGDPLLTNPFQWLDDYVDRQDDEQYWRQWDIEPFHHCFDRPSYHVASWFDIFGGGTLQNFIGMRAAASSKAVRDGHRLIIGPWIHGAYMDRKPEGCCAGEMNFGEAALWDYKGAMLRWFDYWLKGVANGVAGESAVRYFVMGLNQWKEADDWPPPNVSYRRLYFRVDKSGTSSSLNDGTLSWEEPSRDEEPQSYIHEPDDPVPSLGGGTLFTIARTEASQAESWDDLNKQAGCRDQRPIESRCLTYTTAELETDLEITGPVKATLFLSSSCIDTDAVVRLCDVYPDGRSMLLCDGIQRARYRNSDFEPSLLEPENVYEIQVDLWATGNLFRAGHRIRVIVNSSSFPRFDANTGTGESSLRSSERKVAANKIFAGRRHSSFIELPLTSG